MPNQITTAQQSAITHHKGACLVLAGPGSGKTFVITHRVASLITQFQVPGEQILVITFTKAAAMEMEKRFHNLRPQDHPWFGTFHSCFYYILKQSYTSVPSRFITTEEKRSILREICDSCLDFEDSMELEDVERILGLYMNNGLSGKYVPEYADLSTAKLRNIYVLYHKALNSYGYMDFDDLMLRCYELLKNNPEIQKRWQQQFSYILVDECQDMNVLQYEILKLLAGTEGNVFMVGDDDQSIYRFRGARVELMQRFLEEYKPVRVINLDWNFRSTGGIVESCKLVIGQNKNRFAKEIQAFSEKKSGVSVKAFPLKRDMHQFLFDSFQAKEPGLLSNSAIIYRTNKELRSMAYRFRRMGIAYQSKEDLKSIFDEEWYLDVEAYFKLGLGSRDRQYILRVANKPNRFIKREQLVNFTYLPSSLSQAVKHINSMRPYLAIKYIWSGIGYGRWLERQLDKDTDQWDAICEQMEEISMEMKQFATLEDWILHVEEDRLQQKGQRKAADNGEGVHLLTMHASKGLEFEEVYLLEVNKGKVPKGSKLTLDELEEERRLFYVAMTRAKSNLYLCYLEGIRDHTLMPSDFILPILGQK